MTKLCGNYRINEGNLDLRRKFLRLSARDVSVLASLTGWMDRVAETLAREFYEYQFSFGPTLAFFEAHARKRGIPLAQLRQHLEKSQAGYLKEICREAASGGSFGTSYFEKRLFVGQLHNTINLPLKWYMGSYSTYQDLIRSHLRRNFLLRPMFRAQAERSFALVFNLDMQAVTDSFFYNYLESIGLDLTSIHVARNDQDLSDYYEELKGVVRTSMSETIRTSHLLGETSTRMAHETAVVRQAILELSASVQQVSGNAQSLAHNVDETTSSIEEMTGSVRQVAGNADQLSSAVNETSAAIEEMTSSIRQVAGNAQEANQVALKAAQAAQDGRTAVDQTKDGMGQINSLMRALVSVMEGLGKSSAEIGSIIEVIDDIAEQTNLLALNAAIEAARAGDAGRGFAVVADEVRKLAERSAKATGEIGKLIRGIQQETERAVRTTQEGDAAIRQGTELAQSAGNALHAIVGSVEQVVALMGEMRVATQEQSNAANLINDAVARMSSLTNQVTLATKEQAQGSEFIVRAVTVMNGMTQEVSVATSEQGKGAELVVKSAEALNGISDDLARQAQALLVSVASFAITEEEQGRPSDAIASKRLLPAAR